MSVEATFVSTMRCSCSTCSCKDSNCSITQK